MIHGFGRWGLVSVVYSPSVGRNSPALMRFHVIRKKKKIYIYIYKIAIRLVLKQLIDKVRPVEMRI